MADETTPSENNTSPAQQIPAAPKLVVAQPVSLSEEKISPVQSPLATEEKLEASPLSTAIPLQPSPLAEEKPAVPAAKPAMKLDLPKAKYSVHNRVVKVAPASTTVKKVVEVKKNDNPSIISVALDFTVAAVAVAFAVMIVLDI